MGALSERKWGGDEAREQAGPLRETALGNFIQRWQRLLIRQSTRSQLLKLDAEQLRDIGLTRAQALAEGSKPIWKR